MPKPTHLFRPKRARWRVLAALTSLAEGGRIVRASQREIAKAADCCHKTVAHTLIELAAREEIDVVIAGRGSGGGNKPGKYRLRMEVA